MRIVCEKFPGSIATPFRADSAVLSSGFISLQLLLYFLQCLRFVSGFLAGFIAFDQVFGVLWRGGDVMLFDVGGRGEEGAHFSSGLSLRSVPQVRDRPFGMIRSMFSSQSCGFPFPLSGKITTSDRPEGRVLPVISKG